MPDQALELSFEPSSAGAVMAQWEALRAAGLPSQADHRSMTNAPHVTLVAAVGIDPAIVSMARDEIAPLLPARIEVRGLVLLGQGPRVTIAHLVEPDEALAATTARVRTLAAGVRHPVWTPHVTLARRVPRRLLPAALEVLDSTEAPRDLVCDRLRWWDPALDLIEDVAIAPRR
jgi:2'-5' RNA ligase